MGKHSRNRAAESIKFAWKKVPRRSQWAKALEREGGAPRRPNFKESRALTSGAQMLFKLQP
jgi:hypothetical protein